MELNEELVLGFIQSYFPNVKIVKSVTKFTDGGIKIQVKTTAPANEKEMVSDYIPHQDENWFVFYQNPDILVYWRDANKVDRNITSRLNDYLMLQATNKTEELAD